MVDNKLLIERFVDDWKMYNRFLVIVYRKNRQKTPYEIFDSIGNECRHF